MKTVHSLFESYRFFESDTISEFSSFKERFFEEVRSCEISSANVKIQFKNNLQYLRIIKKDYKPSKELDFRERNSFAYYIYNQENRDN